MAKKLGYGGLGNTNGARDFSGRAEATPTGRRRRMRMIAHTAQAPWYISLVLRLIWPAS